MPSGKQIPAIIDRSYGINQKYNVTNIKGSTKTTIYYLSKFKDYYYYVPFTMVNNENKEKIEELVEAIGYCKKNGIWADKPVMMPLFNAVCSCLVKSDDEYDVAEHLLDGLEIDDEDKD